MFRSASEGAFSGFNIMGISFMPSVHFLRSFSSFPPQTNFSGTQVYSREIQALREAESVVKNVLVVFKVE